MIIIVSRFQCCLSSGSSANPALLIHLQRFERMARRSSSHQHQHCSPRTPSRSKHYWEVQVDKSTLAIHVGIASERMAERFSRSNGGDAIADRDSGHDSSDELDDEVSLQDPTVFVTHCMGKLTLPSPTSSPKKNSSRAPLKASSPRSCNIESNVIGVLLDAEAGKVSFYDGPSKECLFSRKIKVTGVIQPAISIVGSGTARMN